MLEVLRLELWFVNAGGPGSSVGIATGYGLDGPGIEKKISVGRDFSHTSRPSLLYNGYRVFPVKRPGRGVDHPPPPSV
jgi:hypothetical protein